MKPWWKWMKWGGNARSCSRPLRSLRRSFRAQGLKIGMIWLHLGRGKLRAGARNHAVKQKANMFKKRRATAFSQDQWASWSSNSYTVCLQALAGDSSVSQACSTWWLKSLQACLGKARAEQTGRVNALPGPLIWKWRCQLLPVMSQPGALSPVHIDDSC